MLVVLTFPIYFEHDTYVTEMCSFYYTFQNSSEMRDQKIITDYIYI